MPTGWPKCPNRRACLRLVANPRSIAVNRQLRRGAWNARAGGALNPLPTPGQRERGFPMENRPTQGQQGQQDGNRQQGQQDQQQDQQGGRDRQQGEQQDRQQRPPAGAGRRPRAPSAGRRRRSAPALTGLTPLHERPASQQGRSAFPYAASAHPPREPDHMLGALAVAARADPHFVDFEVRLAQPVGEDRVRPGGPDRQHPARSAAPRVRRSGPARE